MSDQQPYRMVIRNSVIALSAGATYKLRFDQIGDVFPPGMVGDDVCTVTKDDRQKVFVFLKT